MLLLRGMMLLVVWLVGMLGRLMRNRMGMLLLRGMARVMILLSGLLKRMLWRVLLVMPAVLVNLCLEPGVEDIPKQSKPLEEEAIGGIDGGTRESMLTLLEVIGTECFCSGG